MFSRKNKDTSKDELLFVEVMNAQGEVEVLFHLLLTSVTDAGEQPGIHTGQFVLTENSPGAILTRG